MGLTCWKKCQCKKRCKSKFGGSIKDKCKHACGDNKSLQPMEWLCLPENKHLQRQYILKHNFDPCPDDDMSLAEVLGNNVSNQFLSETGMTTAEFEANEQAKQETEQSKNMTLLLIGGGLILLLIFLLKK